MGIVWLRACGAYHSRCATDPQQRRFQHVHISVAQFLSAQHRIVAERSLGRSPGSSRCRSRSRGREQASPQSRTSAGQRDRRARDHTPAGTHKGPHFFRSHSRPTGDRWFADSSLEGAGFEPSVPLWVLTVSGPFFVVSVTLRRCRFAARNHPFATGGTERVRIPFPPPASQLSNPERWVTSGT
jgi:hypothetical protein